MIHDMNNDPSAHYVPAESTGSLAYDAALSGQLPEFAAESQLPYVRIMHARELLARGIMPRLDNGFSFVIDRRPVGHEQDRIPAEEYTTYLSKRQVPIADIDHEQRGHDESHIPSIQDMLAVGAFADATQASAANSLSNLELCKRFTNAMDGFGDALRNMADYTINDGPRSLLSAVNSARRHLSGLIELLPAGYDRRSPVNADQTLFDYIWVRMSLGAAERSAQSQAVSHTYDVIDKVQIPSLND